MFEDSKIEFLRSIPEGDSIIVIWLQLLSIAGKSNADGYLMVTDGIPYSEQLLSNALRRNPVLLQFALETFIRLKMINVEDGPFHITKWEKHQSAIKMEEIKSKNAIKQAEYRKRQKEKQILLEKSNENVTKTVTSYVTNNVTNNVTNGYSNHIDIDIDKEKDIKDMVQTTVRTRTNKPFIIPSIEEVQSYCIERDNGIDAEKWIDHYTANGWMVGRNKMKDWKAAVRTWEKNSSSNKAKDVPTKDKNKMTTESHYIMREFTQEELEQLPRG